MKRILLLAGLVAGVATGLWYYTQVTDYGYYPSPVDWFQTLLSVFRRQYLVIVGTIQGIFNMAQGTDDYYQMAETFIAKQETFSGKAYPDPPGQSSQFSIGYGHLIVDGDGYTSTSTIDEATGYALLQSDMARFVQCVNDNVTVDLTAGQRAALISLCYNIGCGAFSGSTLLKLLNEGDYDGALAQFPVWRKSQGKILDALVNRRADEQELFLS